MLARQGSLIRHHGGGEKAAEGVFLTRVNKAPSALAKRASDLKIARSQVRPSFRAPASGEFRSDVSSTGEPN